MKDCRLEAARCDTTMRQIFSHTYKGLEPPRKPKHIPTAFLQTATLGKCCLSPDVISRSNVSIVAEVFSLAGRVLHSDPW